MKPNIKIRIFLLLFIQISVICAHYQYQSNLPDHYPKFLKTGPYAKNFQNTKTYNNRQSSGVKTFTKTGRSNIKTLGSYNQQFGGCQSNPRPPINSHIRCSQNNCNATCLSGFRFPDGQTRIHLVCRGNVWSVLKPDWMGVTVGMTYDVIPASCEPICEPPCENNGICYAPNKCNCPDNYSGMRCEDHRKPCLNYPTLPMNAHRTCSTTHCTITCLKGHNFPDGSAIANMKCVEGTWVPSREDWTHLPDCMPNCNPPCLNGGNCLSLNVCQCPQEFRGPQCQYRADVCSVQKLGFNGGYNCSGNSEMLKCSLNCPIGINFEFPASEFYSCKYESGIFEPQPIPQCIFNSNIEVFQLEHTNNTFYSHEYEHVKKSNLYSSLNHQIGIKTLQNSTLKTIENHLPKPGLCSYWSGQHFRTFDGAVFSAISDCAHVLLRDREDNSFSIVITPSLGCRQSKIASECSRNIFLYIGDKEYTLKNSPSGNPVLYGPGGKKLPLPGAVSGLRTIMQAHHIILVLDNLGITLKWDTKNLIQVSVGESFWNRTEGLCGSLDGYKTNDLQTKDGENAQTIANLVDSWKINILDDVCASPVRDTFSCSLVSKTLASRAHQYCTQILNDKRFYKCLDFMDISQFLEACQADFCNCGDGNSNPGSCSCETIEVFVEECKKGLKKGDVLQWRDENICPMQCTGGRIYIPCSYSTLQPTCGSEVVQDTNTLQLNENSQCIEGCFCPEGLVLHNGQCISRNLCPCSLRGREFQPGTQIPKECNTCSCEAGKWSCTQIECGSRCSSIGDPHYQTFDGKRYDFMGKCKYYLVKSSNFSIEAENVACAGSISRNMNFPVNIASGFPSCTRSITIKTSTNHLIHLKQNQEVIVDGYDVTKLPYTIGEDGDVIRIASSLFIVVELENGVEIWWDGVTRVYVDAPPNLRGHTRGLCGTFNANQKDDFLTPEGDVETNPIIFANKWKVDQNCRDVIPKLRDDHPCEVNIHNKEKAEKFCGLIHSKIFEKCHWLLDPKPFYDNCLYDMCSCETKTSDCLCSTLAAYGTSCAALGAGVPWRLDVPSCAIQCPVGQTYQFCSNSCTRTCHDIATRNNCKNICVEGCNCKDMEALDENNNCIPISGCGCYENGIKFPAMYKEIRQNIIQELCICINAVWNCRPAKDDEINKYPLQNNRQTVCNTQKNQEFTTCEPIEPLTCLNMHETSIFETTTAVCRPGCKCRPGYVLQDSFTGSGRCIRPEECPCHHGGKSYKENQTILNDCNRCFCNAGKWNCEKNLCSGTCTTWGDSHFTTFDDKDFDYQGQCEYVLAKGALGAHDNFNIIVQHVPCGSLGVSCTKSISISISGETLILQKDHQLPDIKFLKRMTVRQTNLYIIIESPDLGITLIWDRGTRLSVKVDPRWQNRLKGLCGNYNQDPTDDFQTPSGGFIEVNPIIFGDSWQVDSYCQKGVEIVDACGLRPERKPWALKKCGVLKSELFRPCHNEVPVERFLERCIFDTCACDQGGDCECLCTALAAYAQACNQKGVPIKWRSQQLCPLQCDEKCTTYSPCISTCPLETCDTLPTHPKIGFGCKADTCIEGCAPKQCPPGQIHTNHTYLECVPKNTCKPICLQIDNKTYSEGDLIMEDNCHKCFCSNYKKICTGKPCTIPPNDQEMVCRDGWSNWFNTNRPKNKKFDIEPLPKISNCSIDKITDIQCRTTVGKIDYKATNLNVECSLENGLICLENCPDFEIRILCECFAPKTTTNTKQPQQNCPQNLIYNQCAIECNRLCLNYEYIIKNNGKCLTSENCHPGCVPPTHKPCPVGHFWRDNSTCVEIKHCLCISYNGEIVKPGTIYKESDCEICQCLDNNYLCENICPTVTPNLEFGEPNPGFNFTQQDLLPGFETKLEKCPENLLQNIDINNNESLEINLTNVEPIYGIVTTGHPIFDFYVTSFYVQYSSEDKPIGFRFAKTNLGQPQLFRGNLDHVTPIKNLFETPFEAKHIKIIPKTYHNRIALNFDLIGCSEQHITTEIPTTIPVVNCDETILPENQIKVSSEKTPNLDYFGLKINGENSWQPLFNSPKEWIWFNFSSPTLITGIKTQGGKFGWVQSYQIYYSLDNQVFIPILDDLGYEMLFPGNFDQNTIYTNMFSKPIRTQFMKIVPKKWTNNIQLRLEPVGCFEAYPAKLPTPEQPEPILGCNNCPGFSNDTCMCQNDLYFNGETCINRYECPCKHNDLFYKIGTIFESTTCEECLCVIGGTSQCTPKKCPSCDKGLKSILGQNCECFCEPCPIGQILCPTSNICIKVDQWCDGITDCADDENNCDVIPSKQLTNQEKQKCPTVVCPEGFKIVLKQQQVSPMFKMYSGRKQNTSTINKTIKHRKLLPRKPIKNKKNCVEFICEPINCLEPKCPPNFSLVYTKQMTADMCQTFECQPPAIQDDICNITGRNFKTFDNYEFKFDICDHILARDLYMDEWQLILTKKCSEICIKILTILHANQIIKIYPDLSLEFNGYKYTVEQTSKIGARDLSFSLSRMGNTLLFVSNHYGFWVTFNTQSNTKIGITDKLLHQVDGLCGFYDGNAKNDRRMPNGKQSKTAKEFGDSWSVEIDNGEGIRCESKGCSLQIQNQAFEMCESVRSEVLEPCHQAVQDMDGWISRCLETTCQCLEQSRTTNTSLDLETSCRCNVLESFVVDCVTARPNVALDDWRMSLECPSNCPPNLVSNDCYRRRCELSCSNLAESDSCPLLNNLCFPGCYCPPGLVRKGGDKCVPPKECRDCECNILPHLEFVTYDGKTFNANSNCTYLMAREKQNQAPNRDFEVYITNNKCPNNPQKLCTSIINLLVNNHRIEITRNNKNILDDFKIFIDDFELEKLPFKNGWLEVTKMVQRHVNIIVPKLQIELRVYYPTLGASLRVPSLSYQGRLEGICGDCDRNPDNDILGPNSEPIGDEKLFLDAWKAPQPGVNHSDAICTEEQIKDCPELKDPDGKDPCSAILDPDRFGKCHMLLDPAIFLSTCYHETCNNTPESACSSIETYALGCRALGICLDHHTALCPPKTCPPDAEYQLCGPPCPKSCENPTGCSKGVPKEGCFCPEGLVLKNNSQCVPERLCYPCDDLGHFPGDSWQPDACTKCTCDVTSRSVKCETTSCPTMDTVCEHGFDSVKIKTANECCEKFVCVKSNTTKKNCTEPQPMNCGPNQVRKLESRSDGCLAFVCQCISKSDCPELNSDQPHPDLGFEWVRNESGCCPTLDKVCRVEKCPLETKCGKFYTLEKILQDNHCCPEYKCNPPKDGCIFTPSYTASELGGERPLSNLEKTTILLKENQTFNDGPCRTCVCSKLSNSETFSTSCSVSECTKAAELTDSENFVLEEVWIKGHCCAKFRKTACRFNSGIRAPGEKWPLDPVTSPCTVLECAKGPTDLDDVSISTHIVTCDTACTPGNTYIPPPVGSGECCGSCKQTSCVVDGVEKPVDSQWQSDDFCTEFNCVKDNGTIFVQKKDVICEKPSEELQKKYIYTYAPQPKTCCGIYTPISCLVDGVSHHVGSTWPDPLGDPCVTVTCLHTETGDLIQQRVQEKCNTECRQGWKYTESGSSEICCGNCVQVSCISNGTEYLPGDKWASVDGCTTFECTKGSDGTLSVRTYSESCPDLSECPKDNIFLDGCCLKCNLTSDDHIKSNCEPVPISLEQTVGLIVQNNNEHGQCKNLDSIANFTECRGQCSSGTLFNQLTANHETNCKCCSAIKYTGISVEMICMDGFTYKKQIPIPSECFCQNCYEYKPRKGVKV